ncbi:putative glycoside hydrolase [Marinicrinis lubricantis]|uniref:Glycoside hydrolase n=1 Tax=Marinicrinis lubricantis TaxID=2086470 RepID=A0ABW1IT66_9BACL
MQLLLAAFLALLGHAEDQHPGLTIDQWVEAANKARNAVIVELPRSYDPNGTSSNGEDPSSTNTFVKLDPQLETAPAVKGIYVTAHSANGSRMETLLKLLDETELNAMVIDVKEDHGYITFNTDNEQLNQLGTINPIISDVDELMTELEQHQIYPIARIVVFKDTILANKKPEWSFLNPDGTVWHNEKSNPESFVNPYVKEIWDYNIEVAKEAAKHGFKEIQFDYVRFPEGFERRADILRYKQDDRKRIEAVSDFVRYAREQLEPLGIRVSVDIFGYAASVDAAEGIGQDFNQISQYVDVISPMIYPSHYSTGWFGSTVPDAAPYTTISGAMADTHAKLAEIEQLKPIIRPWIQDFTATWVDGHITYGKNELEAQIKALKDHDVEEFLLWNSGNRYTENVDYDLDGQLNDNE